MTALEELRAKVAAGVFPADLSNRDLGWDVAILVPYEAFSGSLDAAKALHEALLPEWHFMLEDCRPDDLAAVQLGSVVSLDTGLEGDMPISRLWLLAILDALIQKEEHRYDDQ